MARLRYMQYTVEQRCCSWVMIDRWIMNMSNALLQFMSCWCRLRVSTNASQPPWRETANSKTWNTPWLSCLLWWIWRQSNSCLWVKWYKGELVSKELFATICLNFTKGHSLLLSQALDVLKLEPNALDLSAPVKIVGDLHGQFFDLISMLDHCGAPGNGNRWVLGKMVCTSTRYYYCASKLAP